MNRKYKLRFVHLPVRYVPNWKGELSEIGDRAILCNGIEIIRMSKEFWEQAKHHKPTWDYVVHAIREKLYPRPAAPNIETVEPPY